MVVGRTEAEYKLRRLNNKNQILANFTLTCHQHDIYQRLDHAFNIASNRVLDHIRSIINIIV